MEDRGYVSHSLLVQKKSNWSVSQQMRLVGGQA